jgi:hypothetical protein
MLESIQVRSYAIKKLLLIKIERREKENGSWRGRERERELGEGELGEGERVEVTGEVGDGLLI